MPQISRILKSYDRGIIDLNTAKMELLNLLTTQVITEHNL